MCMYFPSALPIPLRFQLWVTAASYKFGDRQYRIWLAKCSFLVPARAHFNSPNGYWFLELNQYKRKVYCVFLAKSFKVGHEVGLPVAGQNQPRPVDYLLFSSHPTWPGPQHNKSHI